MKLPLFAALSLALSLPTLAEEVPLTGDFLGDEVILNPDWTWRYTDAGGKRCTSATYAAWVCALPSAWSPVALSRRNALPPVFFRPGTEQLASVQVMGGYPGARIIDEARLRKAINYDRGSDDDFGLEPVELNATILGKPATSIVSIFGTGQTRVYSYILLNPRTAVLAMTADRSFLLSNELKAAHADFLASISAVGQP